MWHVMVEGRAVSDGRRTNPNVTQKINHQDTKNTKKALEGMA